MADNCRSLKRERPKFTFIAPIYLIHSALFLQDAYIQFFLQTGCLSKKAESADQSVVADAYLWRYDDYEEPLFWRRSIPDLSISRNETPAIGWFSWQWCGRICLSVCCHVEQFDWNGNPVGKYKLDHWGTFTVDEKAKRLILLSTWDDEPFFFYQLP